jgi:hypothetical protein
MRKTAIALTSAIMGAGAMFGYLAGVAPATAQPTDTPTNPTTSELAVEPNVVDDVVCDDGWFLAEDHTCVPPTYYDAPTRTPVEVPIKTGEPAAPRTFMVPVDWCPQEDSCHVDYRSDGHWYVVEGQRPW